MKQFLTAAKRGAAAVSNPVDLTFEWEVTEGEFVEMTAHPPTTGQLALFMADQGKAGAAGVRALFEFLSTVLPDEHYDIIEGQLREGLDVAVVIEVIRYLTEEWSARPTKPSSVSSSSRNNTGRRSTVRQVSAVSNS
jgi:hypothetical protein